MATLYELTGQYQYLLYLMEDPETDPQIIEDSMEALSGDIEAKADGYAKVRLELLTQKAAMKAEIDRLTNRTKAIDKNVDRLMEGLKTTMEVMHTAKIKTDLFTFSIQKNPVHVVMDESYLENIPERYLIQQEPKIDRKQILEDLKKGTPDLEGIAHLEQDTSLRIR